MEAKKFDYEKKVKYHGRSVFNIKLNDENQCIR